MSKRVFTVMAWSYAVFLCLILFPVMILGFFWAEIRDAFEMGSEFASACAERVAHALGLGRGSR